MGKKGEPLISPYIMQMLLSYYSIVNAVARARWCHANVVNYEGIHVERNVLQRSVF